jgi:hypothetical protein
MTYIEVEAEIFQVFFYTNLGHNFNSLPSSEAVKELSRNRLFITSRA